MKASIHSHITRIIDHRSVLFARGAGWSRRPSPRSARRPRRRNEPCAATAARWLKSRPNFSHCAALGPATNLSHPRITAGRPARVHERQLSQEKISRPRPARLIERLRGRSSQHFCVRGRSRIDQAARGDRKWEREPGEEAGLGSRANNPRNPPPAT